MTDREIILLDGISLLSNLMTDGDKRKGYIIFSGFQLCEKFRSFSSLKVILRNVLKNLLVRISRPQVFCKIGALKNFAESLEPLFKKAAIFLKKSFRHMWFSLNFARFLKMPFLKNISS